MVTIQNDENDVVVPTQGMEAVLRVLLDVRILLVSVLFRRASFGLTNQVLTLFLKAVGVSKSNIGIFMTLTLVGDTVISYVLTWYSDHIGRRLVMVMGSLLMLASGLVFAYCENFWVLLVAAILGVISTSGDETGPFKTVEEVCISHLTPPKYRAPIFALYGFLGTLGAAVGSLSCGFAVDYFSVRENWPLEKCYRAIFLVYSAIALVKLGLSLSLSKMCEIQSIDGGSRTTHEETQLLGDELPDAENAPVAKSGFQPQTKKYLPRLLVVFMLDSFGYGFMPPAWIVYYFTTEFGAAASSLGTLFFFTNLVDSVSSIASAFTFHALGPVKAILAAQLPSALFFSSIPFCTSYVLAGAFYFLFCATGTMDVVPRQVLLTSIIPKEDLLRVMGTVNIAKTLARCVGPVFTGKLAEHGLLYFGFIINGVCLFVADVVLGCSFVHLDNEVMALHKE